MCGKHTMCVYDDKPGPGCKGFIPIHFTPEEIAAIVDIHNTLRNRVAMGSEKRGDPGPQPAASNMRIVEWDQELAALAHRNNNRYPSPIQYTQQVWAETYQIGCARVAFQKSDGPNITYREHFICNYGPTGNIPGQKVYRIGEPCTECPDGTGCSVEYPGLCGNEILYATYKKTNKKRQHDERSGSEKLDISLWLGILYFLYI
ncbi:hypothetical protein NQ317_007173 [Molorchus minor]|uniref:SCP domain-containing protein n=1 Tax=Molorchus minor TaxID=1323400 RepID=A0ABQ9K105_9CUCU|nr:hypothetical protein NQ317_007173 [Molorchus minor]